MTIVGTAQVEFWFSTGVHLHHYLNGVLTTVATPGDRYIPFGLVGPDGAIYLQADDSYGEIGYVAPTDLSSFTPWGPYTNPGPGTYSIAGETWYRFQDWGVGMCRVQDNIFVSVLMNETGVGADEVASGVMLSPAGVLQEIVGANDENLIKSSRSYDGVTLDTLRNRIWVMNDFYGLSYIDVAGNVHVFGPINGVSFWNIARWIEYQESSDTLWATKNEHDIVGLNPDDFTEKSTIPFCSDNSSDDGPYTAEVFCIVNDSQMVVAGEGGMETDFNDGLWLVDMASGTKELLLGLDGSEDYWTFSDAFVSVWAEPGVAPAPDIRSGFTGARLRWGGF